MNERISLRVDWLFPGSENFWKPSSLFLSYEDSPSTRQYIRSEIEKMQRAANQAAHYRLMRVRERLIHEEEIIADFPPEKKK